MGDERYHGKFLEELEALIERHGLDTNAPAWVLADLLAQVLEAYDVTELKKTMPSSKPKREVKW